MKYLIFLALSLAYSIMSAQQGVATYFEHVKIKMSIGGENMSEETKKKMMESLEKQMQREYTLVFNVEEATYKVEPKLEAPKPQQKGGAFIVMQNGGSDDVYYKNLRTNTYTNQLEIMGKRFLIKDTLPKREWKLGSETKKIGNYTCYKATATYTTTISTFSNLDNEESVTKEEEEERTITAWYTPEIPVSTGPDDYQGLPGLIMEIHDDDRTLVCNKITLKPEKAVEIKVPSKGKKVNQSEFNAIQEKKLKQFIEQNSTKHGRDNGKTISISIGG